MSNVGVYIVFPPNVGVIQWRNNRVNAIVAKVANLPNRCNYYGQAALRTRHKWCQGHYHRQALSRAKRVVSGDYFFRKGPPG